jgi:hypothetical protein
LAAGAVGVAKSGLRIFLPLRHRQRVTRSGLVRNFAKDWGGRSWGHRHTTAKRPFLPSTKPSALIESDRPSVGLQPAGAPKKHPNIRDQFKSLALRSKGDAPSCGGDALPASLGFRISPCCTTVVRDRECGRQKAAYTDAPRRPSRLRNPPCKQAVRVPPRSEAEGPQGSATYGPSEVGNARSRPRARE